MCGTGRAQARCTAHRRFALTVVFDPPGSDGRAGDQMCRDCCLFLRGVSAQHDVMRLSPGKEETGLFTRLAAAIGNCSWSDKQKAKELSSKLDNMICVEAQSILRRPRF